MMGEINQIHRLIIYVNSPPPIRALLCIREYKRTNDPSLFTSFAKKQCVMSHVFSWNGRGYLEGFSGKMVSWHKLMISVPYMMLTCFFLLIIITWWGRPAQVLPGVALSSPSSHDSASLINWTQPGDANWLAVGHLNVHYLFNPCVFHTYIYIHDPLATSRQEDKTLNTRACIAVDDSLPKKLVVPHSGLDP